MRTKLNPAGSYLQQWIRKLVAFQEASESQQLPAIDAPLLIDVAYYIKQRFDSNIDEPAICALLGEALQKLQKRLDSSTVEIESAPRYFREIVKHLIHDTIRQEGPPEKFLISVEGVAALADSGLPERIVQRYEALISARPMSYRTFLEKHAGIYSEENYTARQIKLYRRIAMSAFRIKQHSEVFSDTTDGLPAVVLAEQNISDSRNRYVDCLQRLKRRDRDLIKLRFGLEKGLDGFQYSFEELRDIFNFESVQQVRNRYHYILKLLKDCLQLKFDDY